MEIRTTGTDGKNEKGTICLLFLEAVCGWFLACGLLIGICGLLELSADTVQVLCFAAAGVAVGMILCRRKHKTVVLAALSAGMIILFLGEENHLWNGLLSAYNRTVRWMRLHTYVILPQYILPLKESAMTDESLFLGIIAAVTGFTCFLSVLSKRRLMMVLWLIPVLLLAGLESTGRTALFLSGMGLIMTASFCSYHSRKRKSIANSTSMTVFSGILAGAFLCIFLAMISMFLPEERYERAESVKNLQKRAETELDRLRYKKEKVNTLPKGRLDQAGTWETSEVTALMVTMSEPSSLYLRGYVGSCYESDHWADLPAGTYYDSSDLFYWMDQWGMGSGTQLSRVWELADQSQWGQSEKAGKVTLAIENRNADSEYLYTPYELTVKEEGYERAWQGCGDSYQRSGQLFGTRSYTCETYENLVKDFPKLAALGYLYRKEQNEAEYTRAESYYNAFVYQNYTKLPQKTASFLSQELGYAGTEDEEHIDYRAAIQRIRSYLEENIVYGNYAQTLPEDEDFLEFFLTRSKVGNAVHYATAAALMFRYYGIPSRYVEGYLITPQDVKDAKPGEAFSVPGSNGHAWTEIYVDGLGWVPVEMTPEYYDRMEQPDLNTGLEADASVAVHPPQTILEEQDEKTSEDLKERLTGIFLNLGKLLLWFLVLFDGFWILVLLCMVCRRIIRNIRRRKAFKVRDTRQAICSMAGYLARIMGAAGDGISPECCQEYRKAYAIGQKAAFGRHLMTEEERKTVEDCIPHFLKMLKRKKGWYEKWILKYMDGLY